MRIPSPTRALRRPIAGMAAALALVSLACGGDATGAHETVEVNQSQHVFIERSDVHGADDNAIGTMRPELVDPDSGDYRLADASRSALPPPVAPSHPVSSGRDPSHDGAQCVSEAETSCTRNE